MLEQFMNIIKDHKDEELPWEKLSELVKQDLVKIEAVKKDVQGKNGEQLESHAFKFEFPIGLKPLGESLASEIWHFGDQYVAMEQQGDKFIFAVAQVLPKGVQ
jgi:hypothetical protein